MRLTTSKRWYRLMLGPLRELRTTLRNIARHFAAADALAASERRLRRVVECDMIGILFFNTADLQITEANDAFLHLYGYSKEDLHAGRLNRDLLVPPEGLHISQAMLETLTRTGRVPTTEALTRHRDGHIIPILMGGAYVDDTRTSVVAFVLDLTHFKHIEAQNRQQQTQLAHLSRITTMGQLASGLAHELNQPLGAIINYSGVARQILSNRACPTPQCPHSNMMDQVFGEIHHETTRAGNIIRRLRGFVRKQEPQRTPMDVNQMVREACHLMQHEFAKHHVNLELQLAEGLPFVLVDTVQIQQVLVNLLQNGIDACLPQNAGPREVTLHTAQKDDDFVLVRVTDTGCGMDDSQMDHLFEAFHTTKPQGMGLGLNLSRSIIEDHMGTLAARQNKPAAGMTFEFTLRIV